MTAALVVYVLAALTLSGSVVGVVMALEARRLRSKIDQALSALASADTCMCGMPAVAASDHHHTIVTGLDFAHVILTEALTKRAARGGR